MKKTSTALALTMMAGAGGTAAALIPSTASANQYTQYTEATITSRTTTTITSTTTTPSVTGPTTVTVPGKPAIVVTPGQPITNPAALPVGSVLEAGVVVISNSGGAVVISDHGVDITIPAGATLSLSGDGSALVSLTKGTTVTQVLYVVASATSSGKIRAAGRQVDATGRATIGKLYFSTNTPNVVLKAYTAKLGIARYIKVSGDSYTVARVSKGHGQVWLHLVKGTSELKASYSSANFTFLHGELAKLKKAGLRTVTTRIDMTSSTGHVYRFYTPLPL